MPRFQKMRGEGGIKIITNERLLHNVNISLFDYD